MIMAIKVFLVRMVASLNIFYFLDEANRRMESCVDDVRISNEILKKRLEKVHEDFLRELRESFYA